MQAMMSEPGANILSTVEGWQTGREYHEGCARGYREAQAVATDQRDHMAEVHFQSCAEFHEAAAQAQAEREARRILAETEPCAVVAYLGTNVWTTVRSGWERSFAALSPAFGHAAQGALADSLAWFLAADVATIAEAQR